VGIESEKIAECLDGDDRTGDGFLFRHGLLDEDFQRFPCAAAESREQFSIIQKITAKDFGDAEYEMPVGYLLKDIHTQPLAELYNALLVAGWAKMAALTGKSQKVFMAAVLAFHAGKAVAKITTIQVTVEHLFDIGPPETVIS